MSAISKIENMLRAALTLLTIGVMTACTTGEGIDDAMPQPSAGKLRLSTGSSVTRSDAHYDDDPYGEQNETREEEKIDRVDLFFFSDAESGEASFFTYEVKNVGEITTADLSVRIPIEMTQQFTDGTAYVYALVNLPSDIEVSESSNSIGGEQATLETLTGVWVHASGFVSKDIPSSFVMRGGSEVTIEGDGKNAEVSGVIRLERLASKIRLWAEIPEELYFDADGRTVYRLEGESDSDWEARKARETVETWESVPVQSNGESNVMLYIYNIATNGRIDGYLGSEGSRPDLGYDNVDRRDEVESAVRRLSKDVQLAEPVEEKYKKYNYTHAAPYYSYPNEWDSTTPVEEHQTYLIIEVPWRKRDDNGAGEIYQRCYYQVPVNALKSEGADGDRLDPNRYYRIKIHIGMLGSKDLGSPTEVEASWEVVDWVTADVDVTIKDRRYLVVNQKEWTMNNVSTVEIPFSTSHEVEIEYCYVNYFRYHDAWGEDTESLRGYTDETTTRHRSEEFKAWLTAAKANEYKEGPITTNDGFDFKTKDTLYYKDEYFYDEVKKERIYYVGKEQPKTFQRMNIFRDSAKGKYTDEQSAAWTKFEERYGMSEIYSCDIDPDKSVIRFTHPLVQWEEIRDGNGGATGSIVGYAPLTNPRTNNLYDEYSRCEIVIKIKHRDWNNDDDLYRETIYITQYPGMYIEVSHNYGDIHEPPKALNNRTQQEINAQPGFNQYVIVNGNNISKGYYRVGFNSISIDTEWYEPNKTQVYCFYGSNNNPNMYVIHTTQLSEENESLYDLGDPRTMYYNNILTTQSFTKNKNTTRDNGTPDRWSDADIKEETTLKSDGPAWWISRTYAWSSYSDYVLTESVYEDLKPNNTANRPPTSTTIWNNYVNHKNNLCYYYPADESTGAGSKANVVAPVFRIASSFGKVSSTTSIEPARKRCAAYQEAGRPAGRWRLPTRAEIQYIARLSAESKIPILLGNTLKPSEGGRYWTANGKVQVDNEKGTVIDCDEDDDLQYSPRCVYDEWYWTKVDDEIGFTPNPLDTEFKWGDRPKDNTQVQRTIQALKNPQAIVAND